jgi:hypothetical protein
VRWYDEKLELFERFVGVGATLADVNPTTVRTYVADARPAPWSTPTTRWAPAGKEPLRDQLLSLQLSTDAEVRLRELALAPGVAPQLAGAALMSSDFS